MTDSRLPLDRPVTVGTLIADSGRTASPRLTEFVALASAAQEQRRDAGASGTSRITRSSALWVLMTLDGGIRHALEQRGPVLDELGGILSLTASPRFALERSGEVHEDFALALSAYLGSLPREQQVVDIVDIAIAIMRSAHEPGGLLPQRLAMLKVSADEALRRLSRLMDTGSTKPRSSTWHWELSRSMRAVAEDFPDSAETTAFDIVFAIARRHPEYADGRLATENLVVSHSAKRRTWNGWAESVASWYDAEIVARTRHKLLDGHLFLLALAHEDAALRSALQLNGTWSPLILEIDDAVAPPGSRLWPVLNDVQFAYGYRNDGASGDDQLGIQGDVNALAEMIIDPKVKPPLSIGLFGKWGTGKSFFMEKMRQRIGERTAGRGDDESAVVQIRFNAWHYTDTSLWASLAIEIFERLADPEPADAAKRDDWLRDHGDQYRDERKALLTQLETYRDAKSVLDADCSQLEAERAQLVKRREKADQRYRKAIAGAKLTDVAVELAKNAEVREELGKIKVELGLEPAIEDLTELGKELRTTAGYLPAIWRLVGHKTLSVAFAAAFGVLTVVTIALAARGGPAWLGSLAGSVGSIVVAVQLVRPAAQRVNTALGYIEKAIRIASTVRAASRTARSREERVLDLKLAEVDREIAETTQSVTSLNEKIATVKATADALTVGRKLYEFLNDRASGYQKHQGVVGMLHRDFRFLNSLLRDHERSARGGVRPIGRVVLYIDDLDRCPPAKVLEVLEAVHLLLALELFVVVVGVDPRWLQNSLRHQYRDLAGGGDPRTDSYLGSMPIEYLEKIFQIPLTLPVMEPDAYAQLIGNIAGLAPKQRSREDTSAPAHGEVPRESSDGQRAPTRAPLEVQPGSAAAGHTGERLDLTRPEVEFAQGLGMLVNSPRSAKRLMNTYRLIRATRHAGPRSRFLGGDGRPGEYQAVLTLLAVVAGHPTLADRLLRALEDAGKAGVEGWDEFLRELAPGTSDDEAGRLLPPGITGQRHELAEWTSLHHGLTTSRRPEMSDDLEGYQRWGRVVARFSFNL
ncbi:P-loop NTPase fold protein [Amycolatopsis sp. BJA-103]|uniref:P-loop NTPase fold protein n=1 Tax=unclassified Amycolatopsis TaxID=2618356 RepID=UPI000C78DBE6|nr:P-loop NTPase fold protein [Amycolatopsis sp. BJA-103]AUI57233.1 hypothetical protein BKN51_02750 [Amycolatopsis sp. BJA-103]PNE15513.1 hypothetical protein B1H26_31135 [Amycolatopsis sp. BJA-103]